MTKGFITKAAVTIMAAAFFAYSCDKPEFVPEADKVPVENDETGTYEEGFYVTVNGAGMFTGEDWDNAFSAADLRNLLLADANGVFSAEKAARVNGKTIHLEEGIYPLSTAANPSPKMSGDAAAWSVTIKGGYRSGHYVQYPDRHPCYLSGGSDWQIVEIGGGVTVTLDAVGIAGGLGKASGQAAVAVRGGSLKMTGCRIINNFSSYTAGAINVSAGGSFKAENCFFESNVSQAGGCLNIDGSQSTCIFTACTFSANASTGQGGAIKVSNGFLYAKDCIFKGNHAETRGGALWLAGSRDSESVLFEDCTFEGNSCVNGGGACWMDSGAAATFRNCSFTGNIASNGSAGSFYANEGADNLLVIEDCTFSGNHGGNYTGGSIHIRGNASGKSVLRCSGSSFDGEWSGTNGGLIALGGTGAEAYFDACIIRNCHAVKNSGVFYHYSNGGRLYFNACSFEDNYIEGSYGTEAATVSGSDEVRIALNNCAVKGSYNAKADANSQQSCWYNIGASASFTFSNCSLIGVPMVEEREFSRYGLVRLNSNQANAHFINNIIVSTAENGFGIYGGDSQTNLELGGTGNLMSPATSQTEDTFSYIPGQGDRLNVYSSDLPALAWEDNAWKWNASSFSGFLPTADVNAAIRTADPDFHSWLTEIGALGKDIAARGRGNVSWPGAYQN